MLAKLGSKEARLRQMREQPQDGIAYNQVFSIWDKLRNVHKKPDGTIVHNVYKNPRSKTGEMRTFKNTKVFNAWKDRHTEAYKEALRRKLTPH